MNNRPKRFTWDEKFADLNSWEIEEFDAFSCNEPYIDWLEKENNQHILENSKAQKEIATLLIKLEKLENQLRDAEDTLKYYAFEAQWSVTSLDSLPPTRCYHLVDAPDKAQEYFKKYEEKNEEK